ncbi:hypothetical protein [Oricola sp.]|uniref:hypothetical protein n=1 Tax=Oricola sp. TaxID=1979950 RepID=UPI0025F32455|nr:hypothetical protein [Oricola sp.]MCI5077762.1 hypothetical protein [Oricola sp.]
MESTPENQAPSAADVPAGVVTSPPVAPAAGSYLEWGPVFGGAVVALGISMLLTQFGAGVGLSAAADATLDGGGVSWNVLIAGLWVILVALASASAGGYIAGRMRTRAYDADANEVEFRDGVQGLVVWGISGVFAMMAVSVMTALAGLGAALDAENASAEMLANAASAGIVFNFASAAGSALAAAGAWFAATTGGSHRDEAIAIHGVVPAYLRPYLKRV